MASLASTETRTGTRNTTSVPFPSALEMVMVAASP